MSPGSWLFFGVTYGRGSQSQQEDKVKLLRLSDNALTRLSETFDREVQAFINRTGLLYTENPIHVCDKDTEVFKVEDFSLPQHFRDAAAEWQSCRDLTPQEMTPDSVKVIMGVRDAESTLQVAFKKLNKSKILDRESTWFWWDQNTFDTAEGPGFVLPEGLCAVYTQNDLFFEKDSAVNAFLDLSAYFRQATSHEVEELVESSPLSWTGEKPIHDVVSKRCKRLMYMFMSQGGFEDSAITPIGVRDVGADMGMNIGSVEADENGQQILHLPHHPQGVTNVFEILTHHYSPGIWDGRWRRYPSVQIVPGQ